MACRLRNTGNQPLAVDLRGGEVLYLAPGQVSRALREELLYDNAMLADCERRGLVARVSARMQEVFSQEASVPVARTEKKVAEESPTETEDSSSEADEERATRARPDKSTGRKRGKHATDQD